MNGSPMSGYVVAVIGILVPLFFTLWAYRTVFRLRGPSDDLIHTIKAFLSTLHERFEREQP